MPGSKRTRLNFDSPAQISDLAHWVNAIDEPGVEVGDVERYAQSMVAILRPALDRYAQEG